MSTYDRAFNAGRAMAERSEDIERRNRLNAAIGFSLGGWALGWVTCALCYAAFKTGMPIFQLVSLMIGAQ